MLEKLSKAQEAALEPHAYRWNKICLSTAPLDRTKAKAAVELAYDCSGLKAPAQFVWCCSPLAMDLAYRLIGDDAVYNAVDSAAFDEVYAAISGSVSYETRLQSMVHSEQSVVKSRM